MQKLIKQGTSSVLTSSGLARESSRADQQQLMLTKAERPEKNDLLKEQKVKRMTSKRKSPVMAYKHKGGKKKRITASSTAVTRSAKCNKQ